MQEHGITLPYLPFVLVGFSKGGLVLNQLLLEEDDAAEGVVSPLRYVNVFQWIMLTIENHTNLFLS